MDTINDHGEAFDWAWALYSWFNHWHGGRGCDKYAAMCKMSGEYKLTRVPAIDFDNNKHDEYEMAVMYYNEITEDNWQELFDKFCDYMDNEWDDDE